LRHILFPSRQPEAAFVGELKPGTPGEIHRLRAEILNQPVTQKKAIESIGWRFS
jgi:hypothetical protein